jgi:hypothetical protein
MHTHGTAVLPEPTDTTSANTTGASTRDQWLAKSTEDAAKALATGNAALLPLLPELVFCPDPQRCPDCEGTGYTWMDDEFIPCHCMAGEVPTYDFPRRPASQARLLIGMSRRNRTGQADVWVPCQHCHIGPIANSPYCRYCHDHVIQVPWVPDCPICNDTGWAFRRTIPASSVTC